MGKGRSRKKSGKKWKSIKVDMHTHEMIKKMAYLLDVPESVIVATSIFLMALLMDGRVEYAKELLMIIKQRYAKRIEKIEHVEETLEELIKEKLA